MNTTTWIHCGKNVLSERNQTQLETRKRKIHQARKFNRTGLGEGRMESYCLTETLETDKVMAVQHDKYT